MNKIQRWVVSLAALVILIPTSAWAVGYGGVGGRPANPQSGNPRTQSIFIYELSRGQSVSDGVRVFNNTNQQQTVALYGVDSVLSSGGAFACAQNADPKHDVGNWIQLSGGSVTLAPNTNQVVPFTVTVPDNSTVGVGEHDGCIVLQAASQTATASNRNGVVLSFRSAIRLVVTIPGKIIKRLDISKIQVSRAKDGNYLVTPVIKNSGNVSLDTNIQVKLLSLIGTKLDTSKPGISPILPRTESSQNFEIKRPFWGGFYRAQVIASYNSNPATELGLGKNANQQATQMKSALFLAVPTPAAALIELVILLILAGLLLVLLKGRQHAKHVRTHWQEYKVKRGDTVEKLAKKHDIPWKKIATVNKLKPPYALKQGQQIKLPPQSKTATKSKSKPSKAKKS